MQCGIGKGGRVGREGVENSQVFFVFFFLRKNNEMRFVGQRAPKKSCTARGVGWGQFS